MKNTVFTGAATALITPLNEKGIVVYAKDANSDDAMKWLAACGVDHIRGAVTGVLMDEDEMIREAILRERNHA